jgi:hypothetical protein
MELLATCELADNGVAQAMDIDEKVTAGGEEVADLHEDTYASASLRSMEKPMAVGPNKLNFELPNEIAPLVEEATTVSIAETEDACYELARATQEVVAGYEKQLAFLQADAREVAEKLLSAATQNIDTGFRYALKLAQAENVQEYVQIQSEFIRTQALALMGQTQELSQLLGKAAIHS